MYGTTVTLYEQVQAGADPFGAPIITEVPVTVENVLIGQPTADDVITSTSLYGKQIRAMLGIPKGDTHDWQDKVVEWTDAYGRIHKLKTFGFPITGIEANIPTPWHMKVRCEEYG
jgi:hypothetical protein